MSTTHAYYHQTEKKDTLDEMNVRATHTSSNDGDIDERSANDGETEERLCVSECVWVYGGG